MAKGIGVIGSGNWGTTLAHLIGQAGHPVMIWSRNPETVQEINHQKTNHTYTPGLKISDSVSATTVLRDIAIHCELIFIVVPSKSFREVAHQLGECVGGDQILVSGTKGIENKTFRTMSEILKEETCCKKVGALSGPNIATEIIQGDPSGCVIASSYQEVIDKVIEVIQQSQFKIYGNKDIKGVEIGGALKNIIAIACGMATGLNSGNNAKAFLMTRGLVEMARYGKFLGANPETFYGLSGIGDLIATCYSQHSRNQTFGRELAKGKTMDEILQNIHMVVEGVTTVQAAYMVAQKFNIFMPITEGIHKILFEHARVPDVIRELMAVRIKFEDERQKDDFSNIKHMLVDKYPIPEYLL